MNKPGVVCAFIFVALPMAVLISQEPPSMAEARQAIEEDQLPPTYVPPGKQTFKEYCAACHGFDGKGGGPAASSLSRKPPNLTTLATRHGGKFPDEYVKGVLLFGPGYSAHGASEMPVWGPVSDTSKTTTKRPCASVSRTFATSSKRFRKNKHRMIET